MIFGYLYESNPQTVTGDHQFATSFPWDYEIAHLFSDPHINQGYSIRLSVDLFWRGRVI